MREDKNIWSSANGDMKISEMDTYHLRNTLNMINDILLLESLHTFFKNTYNRDKF